MSDTSRKCWNAFQIIPLLFLLLAPAAIPAAEFFVAPAGNDSNPGTAAQPFATLEHARQRVRAFLRGGAQPSEPVTVYLRGGDYRRTNAFELAAADSGTAQFPVIWSAYTNERPRLLGGIPLSGFTSVTDAAVLARFSGLARTNILQLDLGRLGLSDFGQMKSRGFGRPTTPAHCELFFDGKPMTLARWPNEGSFEHIAGFPESKAQNDEHGGRVGGLEEGFFYSGDRPRAWKDLADVWVHGYWSWDWANSYERVAQLDPERRLVKTASPFGLYGFRKGQRFYFVNVLEELDTVGEWFLDRKNGLVYFWPPAPIKDKEILLSVCSAPLLKLTDASHVQIRNLAFEAARGNAIDIRGGATNLLADCLIRNIGDYAVHIDGGAGHVVSGCDIFHTGDGGVSLQGGDRQTLKPAGHVVDNCHFAGQGRWSKCYVPAILIGGVGMRASHNLIHDHPHCAILFDGNDHLIELNEIHHIALETGDVGAIYAGRDYTYRGNRIRNNFIHHTGGVGMGAMGAYMDDCVSGTEIFGNVFYKVQRAAFLGGGRDHQVVNNIFVECDPAVQVDGRGLDGSPVWREMVDQTMRRHMAEVPLELYRGRYPEMKSLDKFYGPPGGPAIERESFKGVPPENNFVALNVCAGKWLEVGWNASPGMLRIENNLTNAAPEFKTVPGDQSPATSFALKESSAAWKLGFQQIPLEQIGLRPQKGRAARFAH